MAETVALLVRHPEARVLAGGQSLLPALNLRLSAPPLLIDIGRIPGLCDIAIVGGALRIGALATHAMVAGSAEVARLAPMLPAALAHVAHAAIRNRGTMGGSLAHADPAAELPACALALDAQVVVAGPQGERRIAAESFFTGLFETALTPGEIIVAVEIGPQPEAWGFSELARRAGDYAMVGLAARGGPAPRLAYFAIGTRATLARRAGAALSEGVEAACAALADDLEPHADLQASAATRLHLARVLLRRVATSWTGLRLAA